MFPTYWLFPLVFWLRLNPLGKTKDYEYNQCMNHGISCHCKCFSPLSFPFNIGTFIHVWSISTFYDKEACQISLTTHFFSVRVIEKSEVNDIMVLASKTDRNNKLMYKLAAIPINVNCTILLYNFQDSPVRPPEE